MLLPKTNIEQKLSTVRKKRISAEETHLKEVYSILSNLDNELERIENNVTISNGVQNNKFNIDLLDSDKIYHIDEINTDVIRYYVFTIIPTRGPSKG